MRRLGVAIAGLGLGLGLTACASAPTPACPTGQAQMRTAQIFLAAKPPAKVSDTDIRKFVDTEVTPRFPYGVTLVDGGAQWKGEDNRLIREAAKVVLIVLPPKGDPAAQVEAVRAAYHARFKQDSVVVMPPPTCTVL
jgi:hypothetical protein